MAAIRDLLELHQASVRECSERLESLRARQHQLTDELQRVTEALQRIERAKQEIEEAGAHLQIGLEQLDGTEDVAGSSLDAHRTSEAASEGGAKDAAPTRRKARLGDQHYFMLECLYERGMQDAFSSIEDIAKATGLSEKRIRDQMLDDIKSNLIFESSLGLRLTSIGSDVLHRFKNYRLRHNLPLPTLEDPRISDDLYEAARNRALEEDDFDASTNDKMPHTDDAGEW